jgi:hypothetical protein
MHFLVLQEYKFTGLHHTSRYAFICGTEDACVEEMVKYKAALEKILHQPLTATLTRNGLTNKVSSSSLGSSQPYALRS